MCGLIMKIVFDNVNYNTAEVFDFESLLRFNY